ncbi:MAG: site-2 protease family protein [Actinomycetota bacterium]|nr:site-2 protease family protein [Actinomycetota bacterium]
MTALLYTAGVVLFVVGIAISIGLHELGHMIPAKKFGVKVTQYFVGFGPTLWSRKRGETEYGVKWIPLGGYVKLVGMLPPSDTTNPGRLRAGSTGIFAQLISDARSAEYELVEPGEEDRLFYRKAWWKKLIVMSGGPLVNIAIAFLLFGGVFMFHGVGEVKPIASSVSSCTKATCANPSGLTPAQRAGIHPGDRITAFNGTKITSWDQLVPLIHNSAGKKATISVLRDGNVKVLKTRISTLPTKAGAATAQGFLGVAPSIVYVTKGPGYTVRQMGDATWQTVTAVVHLPVKLYGVGKTVLGLTPRDPGSPVSVVGISRIAGDVASARTVSVTDRFVSLLLILASVNLFLGMFNFVPLLPLDGGHIAGALYEALRRGFAKLFKRPDPGYFDVARLLPVAYTVAGALLVMSVLLIYADVVAPVKLQ